MASPLITLLDATVAYGDGLPPVLQNVSLNVHRGDWIAVAGPNGCGKTTLLAVLGGVIQPRDGVLERKSGLRSALLLQEPDNQFVATSVRNELALSVPLDVDSATRSSRIDAAIERFELGVLLDRNPHRLSGGEKQRLALATVWLEMPDMVLLDEPLSFLDDEMSERVVKFVRELNASGTVVVWATPGDDVALARDVLTLDEGRVVPDVTVQLGGFAAAVSDVFRTQPKRRPAIPVERVRFEAVSFAYGDVPVLEKLSLTVSSGECVGVAGRNGSGKSTLLLLAGGAVQPTSGQITRHAGDGGVLYLPQSPERLFFAETVWEEIAFGLERRGIKRGAAREQANIALELAGLDPVEFASRPPFDLSFGEMRRVAFAIAFALKPELLLLDEPASCLDAAGRTVLSRLVNHACAGNAAVMIASHGHMDVPAHDRIITLRDGRGG